MRGQLRRRVGALSWPMTGQEMRRNLRFGERVRNGLILICIIYRAAVGNVIPLRKMYADAVRARTVS